VNCCLSGLLRPSRVTVPRAWVSVVTAAKRENHQAFVMRSPVMLSPAWLARSIGPLPCARLENAIATASALSGDGMPRFRMSSFDSILIRPRESTPHLIEPSALHSPRYRRLPYREPTSARRRRTDTTIVATAAASRTAIRTTTHIGMPLVAAVAATPSVAVGTGVDAGIEGAAASVGGSSGAACDGERQSSLDRVTVCGNDPV
jgi:hypothetical protein